MRASFRCRASIKKGTRTRNKGGRNAARLRRKPSKKRQKDVDARCTKKQGMSYYGNKNHINIDRQHKFIRAYEVTDASVLDSQRLAGLIGVGNASSDFWADSAYRSQKIETGLKERGLHSHYKGGRDKLLCRRQLKANRRRSKVRVRGEHVFAFQERSKGGKLIRSIGIGRARFRIGMMNLVCNM